MKLEGFLKSIENPLILVLIGVFLNFIPKKASNVFAFLYFLILLIFNCISSNSLQINDASAVIIKNFDICFSFAFFLTYFLLIFFHRKKNYLNIENYSNIKNVNFFIFFYYALYKIIISIIYDDGVFENTNLLISIFYFEFITLITFFLMQAGSNFSNYEFRKKLTLKYLSLHFFAGFLFIIPLLANLIDESFDAQNTILFLKILKQGTSLDFLRILSHYALLIGLLINCALPFFSFWFVKCYSAFNFVFFLIFATGISKISLILLFKFFGFDEFIAYIGIFASIFFLIVLFYENNIKKFLSISILSQNFFLLIFNKFFENNEWKNIIFSEIFLHSIISQCLFFLLILLILSLFKNKSDYFSDLQLNLKSNKLLLILSFLILCLFISFPGLPSFNLKNDLILNFKEKNSLSYYLINIYKILNINIYLFIFHYKLFSLKKEKTINKIQYFQVVSILSFSVTSYLLIFKKSFYIKNIDSLNDFIYLFLGSFIVFAACKKMFFKNYYSLLSSDIVFDKSKIKIAEISVQFYKIKYYITNKLANKFYNLAKNNLIHGFVINVKNNEFFSAFSGLFIFLFIFVIFIFLLKNNI